MNCLLNALAMSFGLMCVLSLKVIVLLWWSFVCQSVYGVPVGACVFPVVPWFFDVFPPDFCLVCVYEDRDFFV